MGIHEFYDNLSIGMAALASRRFRYFGEGTQGIPFGELIRGTSVQLPPLNGEGRYGVSVRDSDRSVFDAAVLISQWKGAGAPAVIYHHGANERPLQQGRFSKNSFKMYLDSRKYPTDATLIAIQAPYHESIKAYTYGIGTVGRFMDMLAVSVRIIDALAVLLGEQGVGPICVSGVSLGGWVTNLHRTYGEKGVDVYVPLMAGAALGDMFFDSVYKKLVAESALKEQDQIRKLLNFEEDFAKNRKNNLYPLLARYDQIITLKGQQGCYQGYPLSVIDKGHVTGALAGRVMREQIYSSLKQA